MKLIRKIDAKVIVLVLLIAFFGLIILFSVTKKFVEGMENKEDDEEEEEGFEGEEEEVEEEDESKKKDSFETVREGARIKGTQDKASKDATKSAEKEVAEATKVAKQTASKASVHERAKNK